jgi:hypothetical protein
MYHRYQCINVSQVSIYQCINVSQLSKYQSIKVSKYHRYQCIKGISVSMYEGITEDGAEGKAIETSPHLLYSRYQCITGQCITISRYQGILISRYQCITGVNVSMYQCITGINVSRYQGILIRAATARRNSWRLHSMRIWDFRILAASFFFVYAFTVECVCM